MKYVLCWTLLALAALILGYLGLGFYVATQLTAPSRQPLERTPADEDLDFSEVVLKSSDGLELEGWWVPESGSSRAALLVHGYKGDRSSQHVLKTASVYARAG